MEDLRTYRIIGAAMAVHRAFGHGFLERVYHEALAMQLARESIPFATEVPFRLTFQGQSMATSFRADLVCFGEVLVELKSQPGVGRRERSQVENYLRCAGLEVGLLLNFGTPSLQYERILNPANHRR